MPSGLISAAICQADPIERVESGFGNSEKAVLMSFENSQRTSTFVTTAISKDTAQSVGVPVEKEIVHSPTLGEFYGQHFLHSSSNSFLEAVLQPQETSKSIKVL